jgi:hypothetical protein
VFAIAEYHSLTVVAQNQKPSRDRQGADAQSLVTLCLEVSLTAVDQVLNSLGV